MLFHRYHRLLPRVEPAARGRFGPRLSPRPPRMPLSPVGSVRARSFLDYLIRAAPYFLSEFQTGSSSGRGLPTNADRIASSSDRAPSSRMFVPIFGRVDGLG